MEFRTFRARIVLVPILVLVNAAAIWGQTGWALDNIVQESWTFYVQLALALGFATAIELIGVYLAIMADEADDSGLPSGGKRLGSYAVGLFSGALNFSHFLSVSLAAAITFGFLSAISPFLWGVFASVRRGRAVAPSRRFWHPIRSIELLRYAAWHGIADEDLALELMSGQGRPLLATVVPSSDEAPYTLAEMLPQPAIDAPISPAAPSAPRAARRKWDAGQVIAMVMDGTERAKVIAETEIGGSTLDRYRRVAKMLKTDPRMVIDAARERVPAEHIVAMRELVGR